MGRMKWWGWGDEGVWFTHQDKPALGEARLAARSPQVEGPLRLPPTAAPLRPRCHVPVVHRLRGHQGPRRGAAQARRAHRQPPWSALPGVYDNVMAAARGAFGDLGVTGYIMCHLSHSYHSGACLYFTFAFKPSERRDPLEEYDVVKSAIQQTFLDSGATLSHHHAVGTEHSRWLEQDISAPGVEMLRALFDRMDPGANLNPGKIV